MPIYLIEIIFCIVFMQVLICKIFLLSLKNMIIYSFSYKLFFLIWLYMTISVASANSWNTIINSVNDKMSVIFSLSVIFFFIIQITYPREGPLF